MPFDSALHLPPLVLAPPLLPAAQILPAARARYTAARRPTTRLHGEWPARSTADAVVIGSGAGGAIAARTLARAGLRVVVLEEGHHHSTASFGQRTPLGRFAELYRDGGARHGHRRRRSAPLARRRRGTAAGCRGSADRRRLGAAQLPGGQPPTLHHGRRPRGLRGPREKG